MSWMKKRKGWRWKLKLTVGVLPQTSQFLAISIKTKAVFRRNCQKEKKNVSAAVICENKRGSLPEYRYHLTSKISILLNIWTISNISPIFSIFSFLSTEFRLHDQWNGCLPTGLDQGFKWSPRGVRSIHIWLTSSSCG